MERISRAYKSGKRQDSFISDLIKLDTPDLLLVQSPKEDDPKVDQMFIEMVRTFIQRNALREVILNQVPTIMVIDYYFCVLLYHTVLLFLVKVKHLKLA